MEGKLPTVRRLGTLPQGRVKFRRWKLTDVDHPDPRVLPAVTLLPPLHPVGASLGAAMLIALLAVHVYHPGQSVLDTILPPSGAHGAVRRALEALLASAFLPPFVQEPRPFRDSAAGRKLKPFQTPIRFFLLCFCTQGNGLPFSRGPVCYVWGRRPPMV